MLRDDALDALPQFAELPAASRRRLAARGAERRWAAGETLFAAGSPPRGLFVVLEGRVRVVRAAGRAHVVHVEGPGGTLGEVPLFAGGPYPATAVADGPTRCAVFPPEAVLASVAEDPALALLFLGRLARRVRELVDRLDRATTLSVTGRLAAWLLERRARAGDPFTLGLTQARLAEELGTVREVVVRTLRELREAGAIEAAGRGRYRVRDEPRLREMAGG
jgi:CRP/FNR family transcriptional regulator